MQPNVTVETVRNAARKIDSEVQRWRQQLHRRPEVRWQEEETISFLQYEINSIIENYLLARVNNNSILQRSIQLHEHFTGGIVVDIFDKEYIGADMVLLRADIDALPIQEETGLPFTSEIPGYMHACGHDIHAAMLLGAFAVIVLENIPLKCNVRFVWQRAEENPITESGGRRLVKEGVCDPVTSVYGLHIAPLRPPGTFWSCPGPMMANSDRIHIVIQTEGGHVAHPERGSNSLDVAVDLCLMLRGIESKMFGPQVPISIVPSILNSGTASNVRPAEAELWLSIRSFLTPTLRDSFIDQLTTQIRYLCGRYTDCHVTVNKIVGQPCLFNTAAEYSNVSKQLTEADLIVNTMDPTFAGEDFAAYLQLKPGVFWFLGAQSQGTGDVHTPHFNPDPSQFWVGVFYWLLLSSNIKIKQQ